MPMSTLPTCSISTTDRITTRAKSTLSLQQLEKVLKPAVNLVDVFRKVTEKHQSNVGPDTTILTRKANALPCLLEQDCEDCDTSTTHTVTSTLNRTIDLEKNSCPQQFVKQFSADTIKAELRSLGLKCGGTTSERANRLPRISAYSLRCLKRCSLQSNRSQRRNLKTKSSTMRTLLNGQPVIIGKWCVCAIVSIHLSTLSNPCGTRVALQSYQPSTLLKFSILCQHNLVDEAFLLYYSAYVKHVDL